MKNVLKVSVLAASVIASFSTLAASPTWDLVELEYTKQDIKDLDVLDHPDGFTLSASKLVTDNIFVIGSYSSTSDDQNGVDLDFDLLNAGVGYRHALTDKMDAYVTVSYVDAEVEASGFGSSAAVDENGYKVATGMRLMANDEFEIGGEISHLNVDGLHVNGVAVNTTYYVSENFGVNLGVDLNSQFNTYTLGARYAF